MSDFEFTVELNNEIQAQRFAGALEEAQIPHRVISNYDTAYAGIFQTQKGWGYVETPPDYRDDALEIYRDLFND